MTQGLARAARGPGGRLACALAACHLVLLAAGGAVAAPAEARFALVAGRNDGAPGRTRLRFAETDALRVADALRELGGFSPGRVELVRGPDREALLAALRLLDARIVAAKAAGEGRVLLVVYYAGHAGETGLELGAQTLGFDELKTILDASAADVRIALVDACRAGSLVTARGASARPEEFDIRVASDPSPDGTAIVASTAPGEDALESAELRGGFFTHHLVVGLRGAADRDLDGRVTLAEAYRYAYARTVEEAWRAAATSQHPTYELELRGKGEIVLAESARAEGRLEFPAIEAHRWLVVGDGTDAVHELRSSPDRAVALGLRAGRYRLVRIDGDDIRAGSFDLPRGGRVRAPDVPLASEPYAWVGRRGLTGRDAHALFAEVSIGTGLLRNWGASETVGLGSRHDLTDYLALLVRLSYGRKSVNDEGFRYEFSSLGAHGTVAWRFPLAGFELFAGPILGAAGASQLLDNGERTSAFVPQGGLAAGANLALGAGLLAHLTWEALGHGLVLNDEATLRVTAAAALGLELEVAR